MANTGTFKIAQDRLGTHMLTAAVSPWDSIFEVAIEAAVCAVKALNQKPALPDTKGFTEEHIFDLYKQYVELHGNADARKALEDGKQVIVALRLETDSRANRGQGVYDDRMAIIWQDTSSKKKKHGKEYQANTEPSAQYEALEKKQVDKMVRVRGGRYVKKKVMLAAKIVGPDGQEVLSKRESKWAGHDVNEDKRLDAGRLAEGTYKFYNDGGTFLGSAFLRPRGKQSANRDVNHDGLFTNADTWTTPTGGTMIDVGDFGMYIHKGGAGNTWSAGCQTLPPTAHKNFFKTLNKKQSEYYYVLVNL